MRAIAKRITAVARTIDPPPGRSFLAYARAVVAYGGGEPGAEASERAAVGLARWLESGRRRTCGPG